MRTANAGWASRWDSSTHSILSLSLSISLSLRHARTHTHTHTVVAVLALGIAVGFKYAIIGKRTPGRYNWDESSYCQRWQVCYLYWYWCLLVKICLIRIQSNKY